MNKNSDTIPLVEETATIAKRSVRTGKVSVRTETYLSEELVATQLTRDAIDITRIEINEDVDEIPQIRTEGEVTVVPVVEERLVVEKRLVLVEEIHIRRRTETEELSIPVQLRKQRAVVERSDDHPPASPTQGDDR